MGGGAEIAICNPGRLIDVVKPKPREMPRLLSDSQGPVSERSSNTL